LTPKLIGAFAPPINQCNAALVAEEDRLNLSTTYPIISASRSGTNPSYSFWVPTWSQIPCVSTVSELSFASAIDKNTFQKSPRLGERIRVGSDVRTGQRECSRGPCPVRS